MTGRGLQTATTHTCRGGRERRGSARGGGAGPGLWVEVAGGQMFSPAEKAARRESVFARFYSTSVAVAGLSSLPRLASGALQSRPGFSAVRRRETIKNRAAR